MASKKHALYKPVSRIDRSSLQQGTLKTTVDESTSPLLQGTRNPLPGSSDGALGSTRDISESSLTPKYTEPGSAAGSGRSVLVMNVDASQPATSNEVVLTETRVASPVKVVRHAPAPTDWRRFSSNFVHEKDSRTTPPLLNFVSSQTGTQWVEGSLWQPGSAAADRMQDSMVNGALEEVKGVESEAGSMCSQDSQDTEGLISLAQVTQHSLTGDSKRTYRERDENKTVRAHDKSPREQDETNHCDDKGENTKATLIGDGDNPCAEGLGTTKSLGSNEEQSKRSHSATTDGVRKQKQARTVQSRYMMGVSKKPPPFKSVNPESKKKPIAKPNTAGNKLKPDDSFKIPPLKPKLVNHQARVHPPLFHAVTTSTPAVVSDTTVGTPHMSAIYDGSFICGSETVLDNTPSVFGKSKQSIDQPPGQKAPGVSEWQLELWSSRLLQAVFVDVMSWKALKQQEQEACVSDKSISFVEKEVFRMCQHCQSQLFALRKFCVDLKQSNAELRKAIFTEEHLINLDKAINTQLQGLEQLCGQLPHVEHCYRSMHKALDATRHELIMEGFTPVVEDQMQDELLRSEALLGDIVTAVGGKFSMVSNLAGSTKALHKVLRDELKELKRCWEELAKARESQIYQTSLFFEERQRSHSQ